MKLFKKYKTLILAGALVLFVTTGLIIWAGVIATKKVVSVLQAQNINIEMSQVANQAQAAYTNFQPLPCWLKAQSLMNVQPWLERPMLENLNHLKSACLAKAEDCKADDCNKTEDKQDKQNNQRSYI